MPTRDVLPLTRRSIGPAVERRRLIEVPVAAGRSAPGR